MGWRQILEYREFCDVPRMILVLDKDRFVLLDGPFVEAMDDYQSDYDVYELAADPRAMDNRNWGSLSATGRLLGSVPVASIEFDVTRRQAITSDALDSILQ